MTRIALALALAVTLIGALTGTCAAAPDKPKATARELAQHASLYSDIAEFCPEFVKVRITSGARARTKQHRKRAQALA
jgi:hypothetical protein